MALESRDRQAARVGDVERIAIAQACSGLSDRNSPGNQFRFDPKRRPGTFDRHVVDAGDSSHLAVGYLSRRVHAEGAKSAKRAEKTSKEAAAHALPAARAAREQTATRSTDASNAGSSVVCICGSRDRLTPASGRRCRKGILQPFSAVSVSLLAPRESSSPRAVERTATVKSYT